MVVLHQEDTELINECQTVFAAIFYAQSNMDEMSKKKFCNGGSSLFFSTVGYEAILASIILSGVGIRFPSKYDFLV